jgi:hypothetical protein
LRTSVFQAVMIGIVGLDDHFPGPLNERISGCNDRDSRSG